MNVGMIVLKTAFGKVISYGFYCLILVPKGNKAALTMTKHKLERRAMLAPKRLVSSGARIRL